MLVKTIVRFELHAVCGRYTIGKNDGAITALATLALTFFTFALWRATTEIIAVSNRQHSEMQQATAVARDAANVAKDSVDLSRREFISTHRPSLIVRHMHLRMMNADQSAIVRFTIVNQGQSNALRTEWRVGMVIAAKETNIYGMDGVNNAVRRTLGAPLAPGLDHIEDFESPQKISREEIDKIYQGHLRLTICGVIAYFDGKGDVRRTSFVRQYDPDTKRFHPTKIEDNEYQD